MILPTKDFFPVIYTLKLAVNENDQIQSNCCHLAKKRTFIFLIFVFVAFFVGFFLVSLIYQSSLLMKKVQAHFGIQQLACAPVTTMASA